MRNVFWSLYYNNSTCCDEHLCGLGGWMKQEHTSWFCKAYVDAPRQATPWSGFLPSKHEEGIQFLAFPCCSFLSVDAHYIQPCRWAKQEHVPGCMGCLEGCKARHKNEEHHTARIPPSGNSGMNPPSARETPHSHLCTREVKQCGEFRVFSLPQNDNWSFLPACWPTFTKCPSRCQTLHLEHWPQD